MEVIACRSAVALLVTLAACSDDDVSDGPENFPNQGPDLSEIGALADLDRLTADADAYRFIGGTLRTDASIFGSEDESSDLPLFTDGLDPHRTRECRLGC